MLYIIGYKNIKKKVLSVLIDIKDSSRVVYHQHQLWIKLSQDIKVFIT